MLANNELEIKEEVVARFTGTYLEWRRMYRSRNMNQGHVDKEL